MLLDTHHISPLPCSSFSGQDQLSPHQKGLVAGINMLFVAPPPMPCSSFSGQDQLSPHQKGLVAGINTLFVVSLLFPLDVISRRLQVNEGGMRLLVN